MATQDGKGVRCAHGPLATPAPTSRASVTLGIPLDADHVAARRDLRRRIGARSEPLTSLPHVSLVVLLDVEDPSALDGDVGAVAARTAPLSVSARGLGVFDDGRGGFVLYVPVVRTAALAALHQDLCEVLAKAGVTIEGHHRPRSWVPHITIWDGIPTPEALAAAVAQLAPGAPAWMLPVTSLVRLDRTGLVPTVPLRGAAATATGGHRG